ncbi:MAG: DUF58 domain-containing protein, partial [Methylococcales bacterium]|nr:DUF58 domain-containing protein [Methylococcales bacterium]
NELKISHSRVQGRAHAKFRGKGMDYHETRPYVEGDDARNIDWRVTARMGELHSKVFVEERDRPVLLVVDFSPSLYFGTRNALKSVVASRLAALLAWHASHRGDRVGGLLFTPDGEHDIRPGRANRAVLPLLNALVEASALHHRAGSDNRLARALEHASHVARPGSLILLISDFYQVQESLRQPLARLAAHNDVISFFISDPIEQALPAKFDVPLSNGKTRLLLRPQDVSRRASIKAHFEHRLAWISREMAQLGQPVIPISTQDNISEAITRPSQGAHHA